MLKSLVSLCLIFAPVVASTPPDSVGKILIVHGSDTSVNGGLDTGRRHPILNTTLYSDPSLSAFKIMEPAYRNAVLDSYGHPLIMTWWMLDGGMMEGSVNTNVPYPSTLPLHLMRKYHGASIAAWGDELTFHYHTWVWTDYDNDGVYHWNQALNFLESRADFDRTMAQDLIEEKSFPVSFRSGWHAMDNEWQRHLDGIIPFSLHNSWPAKRLVSPEPMGNVYDWSRTPSTWVPFHPSPDDYQAVGNSPSWNVRCAHLGAATRTMLEEAFIAASNGTDQVLCLWDHLAEQEILDRLKTVNATLKSLSTQYNIPFEYKTAVDAMQTWLRTTDSLAPALSFQQVESGGSIRFTVQTDEAIFQRQPFVAVKTRDGRYFVLSMKPTGPLSWTSDIGFDSGDLAKAAAAVTDSVGNLSKSFMDFVPDDVFMEFGDAGLLESSGSWSSQPSNVWGTTSRYANVQPGDSAEVSWSHTVQSATPYKVFLQVPNVTTPVTSTTVALEWNDSSAVRDFIGQPTAAVWHYLGTVQADIGAEITVRMVSKNTGANTATAGADVVRFTPLVQVYDIGRLPDWVALGYVSLSDTVNKRFFIENRGTQTQMLTGVSVAHLGLQTDVSFPVSIPPGGLFECEMALTFPATGTIDDSLILTFENYEHIPVVIPISVIVERAVRILDNDDPAVYAESGPWYTSNAVSYGKTSRYSFLSAPLGTHVTFETTALVSGYYDVLQMVPPAENSTNHALYTITVDGTVIDSTYINQQATSGWVSIATVFFSAGSVVQVRVINDGSSTSGVVLRSDAVLLRWKSETARTEFIIDDGGEGYFESGSWNNSVAQVYGPSSRFSSLTPVGQYAVYSTSTVIPGDYTIEYIIPASVNATDNALYTIRVNDQVKRSVYLDQRVGGGQWVDLGTYRLPASSNVEVKVENAGGYTAGSVLRADAVRVRLVWSASAPADDTDTPKTYALEQNFPNPFNAQTTFRIALPRHSTVSAEVYDVLGRAVWTQPASSHPAGNLEYRLNANDLASGMYLLSVHAAASDGSERFRATKKLILLK